MNPKVSSTFFDFSQENFALSDFGLKCYNIGFETAKKISISFSFGVDAFIEEVTKLNGLVADDKKFTVKKKSDSFPLTAKTKNCLFFKLRNCYRRCT